MNGLGGKMVPGGIVDRREDRTHAYRLHYGDGETETVEALTPSEAVKARGRLLMPRQITDLTVLNEVVRQRTALAARRLTTSHDLEYAVNGSRHNTQETDR